MGLGCVRLVHSFKASKRPGLDVVGCDTEVRVPDCVAYALVVVQPC
jgi:hypothetical protein